MSALPTVVLTSNPVLYPPYYLAPVLAGTDASKNKTCPPDYFISRDKNSPLLFLTSLFGVTIQEVNFFPKRMVLISQEEVLV